MRHRRTLRERALDWSPSIIYALVVGTMIGLGIQAQCDSQSRDNLRVIELRRIADALEKIGEP